MRNHRFIIAFIFALLLLTGCQRAGESSAERAATQQIIRHPADGEILNPNTIEVLQTQVFEEDTFVVVSYQRNWNSRDEDCLMLVETHHELINGWVSGGGSGTCTETEVGVVKSANPMHLSGGTRFRGDQNKTDISHVMVRVNDPAIVRVSITWDDGQMQEGQVVKGIFVAMRAGKEEVKTAAGLNEQNELVYTAQH